MSNERQDYVVTNHLRERYVQRTNKKYDHMQECREEGCELCSRLKIDIKYECDGRWDELNEEILDRMIGAEEDKWYTNNTGFMEWYYMKYGYDKRFHFLHDKDILFVVIEDRGKQIGVTCMPAKQHLTTRNLASKPNFGKIKKRKQAEAAKAETVS